MLIIALLLRLFYRKNVKRSAVVHISGIVLLRLQHFVTAPLCPVPEKAAERVQRRRFPRLPALHTTCMSARFE